MKEASQSGSFGLAHFRRRSSSVASTHCLRTTISNLHFTSSLTLKAPAAAVTAAIPKLLCRTEKSPDARIEGPFSPTRAETGRV
jgi:hypothetical protein